MAKQVKRNRKPVEKVNALNLVEGVIYLNEKSFGEIHPLENEVDDFGEPEYVFKGSLHKGEVSLISGRKLTITIPSVGNNHGYTLEGLAQEIFKVDGALTTFNPAERRTFSYINNNSVLNFVGDPEKVYELTFKIYDNAQGTNNYRWVVINATEL